MADSEVEDEVETKAGAGVYFFWTRHWVLRRVDVRDRQRANQIDRRTRGNGNGRKGKERRGDGSWCSYAKSTLDEL